MDKFPAIVELFGHRRIAGFVSETQIAGAAFLSVEVPSLDNKDGFSRYYSANAIYCINPVSEDVMNDAVRSFGLLPVDSSVYNPLRSDELRRTILYGGDTYDERYDADYEDVADDDEQKAHIQTNDDGEIPF